MAEISVLLNDWLFPHDHKFGAGPELGASSEAQIRHRLVEALR